MNPFKDNTKEEIRKLENIIKLKEKQVEFKKKECELKNKDYCIDIKSAKNITELEKENLCHFQKKHFDKKNRFKSNK
jgi:hypothetical protein